MLVVDASCMVQVLTGRSGAEEIRRRLERDADQAAPHAIDVEVFGVIRRDLLNRRIDGTAAEQAIDDLRSWPAERFGHRPLLARAWELRDSVSGWDAMYVALAEALDATLLTLDRRLASAPGPRCAIEVPSL
jgi:predicted nucleic acid-binding protein